ncbi:DUF7533 family protein [Halobiforma nitratireducens]|uniref:Uncharacterized protein n=1 Tax=Halobiforma nitratireducens JCM 10879 TaxID=1227454 RepID=M0LIQ8_9EURY|nr:hypothetical protein [Halobiforma nitratireducens]EMA33411.1 hypothetical protein C446_14314 [Halobiforma nitratireducens JCM 10879]
MAGFLDTIKLASVLVLAIPAALAGLELLFLRGRLLPGSVLLGLAGGLVVVQQRLTTPGDAPGIVARRLGTAVLGDGESADDGTTNAKNDDSRS